MVCRIILAGAVMLLAAVSAVQSDVVVKKIDYKGWRGCFELSNSLVRLVVVPAIGGRIMEYSLDGHNVIWQNADELGVIAPSDIGKKWHNYGGYKAWNAPQSRWRSPDNDNFYDYAAARWEVIPARDGTDSVGVRVTCAPVSHLGFQFSREIRLARSTSQVRIVETMRNIGNDAIEWSVWEVTQVNTPCDIAFPVAEDSKFPLGWALMGPELDDKGNVKRTGNIAVLHYVDTIDKIGTDCLDGWMAYLAGSTAYVKRWRVMPGALYPDNGCNAEIFTADKAMGGYVEMEVLGPVVTLQPGEETHLVEDWYLVKVTEDDPLQAVGELRRSGFLPRSVPTHPETHP